jgi:hypothetical protein
VDFRQWDAWSPWEGLDPAREKSYSGSEFGVGSRHAWSGNHKVGRGRMEITGAEQNVRVEIVIDFLRPVKATNTSAFVLEPSDHGTDVTWSMTGRRTVFMRATGIFRAVEAAIGRDFERGLGNLKTVVEASSR